MKKILALLTSLILVISIVSCGSGNADTTTESAETTGATTESKDYSVLKSEGTLSMGTYYGASASEMMTFQIYLTFNADGTFVLTNGTDEKGSGTYALADGVYTLTFDEEKTTTFIVKADGTILVTSDLYYGKASISIDYVDDIILSYQGEASVTTEATTTTTTPVAITNFAVSTGTYFGNYVKESAMAGTVNYVYTATVGADGTFAYSVKFAMGEKDYDGASASGTYTVENNVFTFTDTDGNATEGALTADNTIVISLKASDMASSPYEVTLVLE